VAEARKAIAGASDADMMKTGRCWPRQTIIHYASRGLPPHMIFNHIIHHRAQLTV